MKITTQIDTYGGYDSFKLSSVINYRDYKQKVDITIASSGANKHEAVERSCNQIDLAIKSLNELKSKLVEV